MFYIIIGIFNNCIFNSPIVLELLYSNNMGDIQFNNCSFNSSLTIDLNESKLQFNNCTFNEISYLNNETFLHQILDIFLYFYI